MAERQGSSRKSEHQKNMKQTSLLLTTKKCMTQLLIKHLFDMIKQFLIHHYRILSLKSSKTAMLFVSIAFNLYLEFSLRDWRRAVNGLSIPWPLLLKKPLISSLCLYDWIDRRFPKKLFQWIPPGRRKRESTRRSWNKAMRENKMDRFRKNVLNISIWFRFLIKVTAGCTSNDGHLQIMSATLVTSWSR